MRLRRFTAAATVAAFALGGSVAAAERRPRPTTLYLSTGTAEGGTCTPTELTTRPTGGSNCGSLLPTGGSTTWISPATDEGYPFLTPAGAEVEGQVTIGPDLVGYRDFTVDITVELNGEVAYEQSTTHSDGMADSDLLIEFSWILEQEMDIESGKVTVAINGVTIRSNFVDGSGGSFLKFPPVI